MSYLVRNLMLIRTDDHGGDQEEIYFPDYPPFHLWVNGLRMLANKCERYILIAAVEAGVTFAIITTSSLLSSKESATRQSHLQHNRKIKR